MYEAYLSGKLSKDGWDDYLKGLNTHVFSLSDQPMIKNKIGVFTG
jgi:hypothetical protein